MVKIDMEMPELCGDCVFYKFNDQDFCVADKEMRNPGPNERAHWCPLIEVEEPQSPCSVCQEFVCDGCEYWNGR